MGASFDSPESNKAFSDNNNYPYDLLSDGDGAMSRAYGVAEAGAPVAPRKSVLIAPDGTVAIAYDEVAPADHAGQVLEDLKGLS